MGWGGLVSYPTRQSTIGYCYDYLVSSPRDQKETECSNALLQTTPMNEMLSFHFSRFCLSQSQGSRREREFCSLNLKFRDENKILLSISQGSRRDRDIFFQVSCFEMGLRDEINLILTRIFEIEKSRHALYHTSTATTKKANIIFTNTFFKSHHQ